jgi:hypothetical protein
MYKEFHALQKKQANNSHLPEPLTVEDESQ